MGYFFSTISIHIWCQINKNCSALHDDNRNDTFWGFVPGPIMATPKACLKQRLVSVNSANFSKFSLVSVNQCKFSNCNLPGIFLNYYFRNSFVHNHNTKISNDPHLCRVNNSHGQQSLKHLGVQIWQKIPKSIQMIRSVKMFLKFLKKWYINEEIDWWLYFFKLVNTCHIKYIVINIIMNGSINEEISLE